MMQSSRRVVCLILATLCWLGLGRLAAAAEKEAGPAAVRLAAGGKALLPVVVPAKPSQRVRRAGGTLADYLGRISGATFAIETGDGQAGIAVGRVGDFPAPG